MRHLRIATLAALLPFVPAETAHADVTGSLAITVQVTSTCKLGAATLDFGNYAVGQRAELRAQGTITYEGCAGLDVSLGLDGGRSGNTKGRTLVSTGGETLNYQLYRNASRTQIWGTNADALTPRIANSGAGSVTVYGAIAGGQTAAAGRYTDTVVVTLSF